MANALLEMEGEPLCPPEDLDALLDRIQREQGLTYAPLQVEAVKTAAQRQVMLLTGGPGTGKTTSLRGILSLFDHLQLRTALTAPTGRAAKRLSETCGAEASTIHRLLEPRYDSQTGGLTFTPHDREPLDTDAVILDDASMVDLVLMQALLPALPGGRRLVLGGDPHQLPSLWPGHLLSALLRPPRLPPLRLTDTFRATGNGIGRSFAKDRIYVRIDHVFCSDHWRPFAANIDSGVHFSDHYPFTVWLKPQ